ncbi:hypothetical protein S4054249_13845 [Pseudoalteromonas luteoviolacea]|uniref:Uncharacterized protein n=1 Tax=Pseudoalteromonas luteoviolacea S4054 TaxID=1129367 RepID=A0A0F6A8P0_9GAMM|nr:hypothetical protein S4054249_13845 [Pseudoalteromonas luteoviolacea]AOT13785.1 hypothetical protein S40542_13815 [Pseudoalteromonas luteoviolacea]AOT18699.1 hypothetical protein S4054_13820 [Pseudoalteromonas luteoviolacea]KKE81769.1 hypothetical protein N479_21300 [Pseudoalteromonas luteoviolacea S4054]KZN67997.1 hypothetical protein N481_23440 [Pseudoalteromonas luteoviolacea S4047-1]
MCVIFYTITINQSIVPTRITPNTFIAINFYKIVDKTAIFNKKNTSDGRGKISKKRMQSERLSWVLFAQKGQHTFKYVLIITIKFKIKGALELISN